MPHVNISTTSVQNRRCVHSPSAGVVSQLEHVRIVLRQDGDRVALLPDDQPRLLLVGVAQVDSVKLKTRESFKSEACHLCVWGVTLPSCVPPGADRRTPGGPGVQYCRPSPWTQTLPRFLRWRWRSPAAPLLSGQSRCEVPPSTAFIK